jgi:biopolymer transport protein ExbB
MNGLGAEIWRIWLSGGWVMIPLLAVAALLYAEAAQILLTVRRTQLDDGTEMRWWDWVRSPDEAAGRVGEIIRYTQSDVSSARQVRNRFDEVRTALLALVERRTRFVATLVAAAPLLGLLGTVTGMLQTFLGLATSAGGESAEVIASGISEALVTTQTGLTVALPGLFLVMTIQRRRRRLDAKLARLESLTLGHLRFD